MKTFTIRLFLFLTLFAQMFTNNDVLAIEKGNNAAFFTTAASPDIIFTSDGDSCNHQYGMAYYDSSLYTILYRSDQVSRVSLIDTLLVDGYPTDIGNFGNHGIEIDTSDGSIYTGTSNSVITHHSASHELLETKIFPRVSDDKDYQPINMILHNDELFVADRKKDSIYVLDKITLDITTGFPILGMDSSRAGGYIDLFVYKDKFYIVSDELSGITTMNLDGTEQDSIMVSGYTHLEAFGIYVKDDLIFLNGHRNIIITDLMGNVLDSWDIEKPEGYEDYYIEMEIVDDKMYIAS
ncbi:MAG: hypothetical protein KAI81_04625, partial [Candidatus Marinimicrobia bacterium]|nr:hypothetical protein [Candidatus Neomarinimicrobiota bacterium]